MKIATYGAMHLGVAFAVAWTLTGDVAIAGAIALVEPAVQTVAYALHERAWRDPRTLRRRLAHVADALRRRATPPLASIAAADRR